MTELYCEKKDASIRRMNALNNATAVLCASINSDGKVVIYDMVAKTTSEIVVKLAGDFLKFLEGEK